jgi:hypothetical protein
MSALKTMNAEKGPDPARARGVEGGITGGMSAPRQLGGLGVRERGVSHRIALFSKQTLDTEKQMKYAIN